jgi:23S rRNA (uracil1939-C5)-methyltransferase
MNLGDIVTVDIASINSEGEGVARFGDDSFVLFVPGVLPGERAVCRVTRTSKKYAAAKATKIVEPSKERVSPLCPSYDKCGGCQLQHSTYDAQLEIKKKILTDAMIRIGRIEPPGEVTCSPSPERWGYRNKTTLPVQRNVGGKSLVCGYYERRTHNVVPFDECPVLRSSLERATRSTIGVLSESGLKGYDERKKIGDIRHIAARSGNAEDRDEIITGIVAARELTAREFGRLRNIGQRISGENSDIVGSVLNLKSGSDNFIWGPVFKLICGKKFVNQALNGYRFRMDISAFFQINSDQAEAIFEHVRSALGRSSERLLELYSGVGSLTAYLAGSAGKLDAVEEWRPAARQLKENMTLNGIDNVEAHADSAENFLQSGASVKPGAYDTIVLDPPRTGCDERVVNGIKNISPKKIIYVSCNPATLARDVSRLLADGGYALESLMAFDMFPQTAHVESVAVISRP